MGAVSDVEALDYLRTSIAEDMFVSARAYVRVSVCVLGLCVCVQVYVRVCMCESSIYE